MYKVSVIGLGWLGLKLAQYLQSINMSVIGSRSSQEGVEEALSNGIDCLLFNTAIKETLKDKDIKKLFNCHTLVITLPPNKNYGFADYPTVIETLAKTAEYSGVQHIIFTSSTSVYGQQVITVDETSKLFPKTESAKAIVVAERALFTNIDTDVTIVRLGGLFGGKRLPQNWIPQNRLMERPKHRINFIHRNDVILAISELIRNGGEGKEIYNIVSPEHPTRKDFYTAIAQKYSMELPDFAEEADTSIHYYGYVKGNKLTDKYSFQYQHSIYE